MVSLEVRVKLERVKGLIGGLGALRLKVGERRKGLKWK